jgi:hypothetical protein
MAISLLHAYNRMINLYAMASSAVPCLQGRAYYLVDGRLVRVQAYEVNVLAHRR